MVIKRNVVPSNVTIIIMEVFFNSDEKSKLNQNGGTVIQINCSPYQSVVRKEYDNLFACEWRVDESGVKVPPDAIIEVINLEISKESEESNPPNFKESHILA